MKDIKQNIILFLSQNISWTTARDIAEKTNSTVRSVKYYISLINDESPNAIISSNKGYKLNRVNLNSIISVFMDNHQPVNYTERKRYILKELIIGRKEYDFTELADDLYISTATLQNELSRIRCELLPHGIHLHIKKDIVSISGEKEDIQKYYLELIRSEVGGTFFQIDSIQQMFNKVDLREIEKILKEELINTKYFLDNHQLISVLLHIGLLIEFKNRNSALDKSIIESDAVKEHVTQTVVRILNRLQEVYDYDYTPGDIFEISMLLSGKLIFKDYENIENLRNYVGEDISDLLEYIVDRVKKNYSIDLGHHKFKTRFAFHLQKLMARASLNLPSNFSNNFIKNDYPLMYSVATYIAYLIEKKTGIIIVEEEIAYISIHIGAMIDEDIQAKNKLNCVIFSPDYYVLGKNIFDKISQTFSSYLTITNFITTYSELEMLDKTDIIISTAQLRLDTKASVVISTQVSFNDIQNIYSIINELLKTRKKNEVAKTLSAFYTNDLFYTNLTFTHSDEVIDFLTEHLESKGLVDSNFKEGIYERERISPSCYGNVAIPHPLTYETEKSAMAISIHPEGIQWGTNIVNIVIMLSISDNDKNLFNTVFDLIAKPVSDEKILEKLIKVTNYDDFINIISNYFSSF